MRSCCCFCCHSSSSSSCYLDFSRTRARHQYKQASNTGRIPYAALPSLMQADVQRRRNAAQVNHAREVAHNPVRWIILPTIPTLLPLPSPPRWPARQPMCCAVQPRGLLTPRVPTSGCWRSSFWRWMVRGGDAVAGGDAHVDADADAAAGGWVRARRVCDRHVVMCSRCDGGARAAGLA